MNWTSKAQENKVPEPKSKSPKKSESPIKNGTRISILGIGEQQTS